MVEPMVMVSPGRIGAHSPGLSAASRSRVPLALPASLIDSTDAPWSTGSIWMWACSRDARGSSTRTWHFEERPTVTRPLAGSGSEKNASVDITNRCSPRPVEPFGPLPPLSVISVSTTTRLVA